MSTSQACVYLIVNNLTGATYVGSSSRVQIRIATHKSELRRGSHHNTALQADWLQHGEENFVFKVVEHLESKADQEAREQHWMDHLAQNTVLYNIQRIATVHGRKPIGDVPMIVINVRLTGTQKEKLKRIGGAEWVRSIIDDEPEPGVD